MFNVYSTLRISSFLARLKVFLSNSVKHSSLQWEWRCSGRWRFLSSSWCLSGRGWCLGSCGFLGSSWCLGSSSWCLSGRGWCLGGRGWCLGSCGRRLSGGLGFRSRCGRRLIRRRGRLLFVAQLNAGAEGLGVRFVAGGLDQLWLGVLSEFLRQLGAGHLQVVLGGRQEVVEDNRR